MNGLGMIEFDHLAVAASSLDEGQAHVEEALGVALQPGGQHTHFGTHNLLLGLEDGLYLEVISIDPAAPPLTFPRWFDLDRFNGGPRITNWICRTKDLAGAVEAYPDAGQPVALSRGDLRWQMAVPEDGILPLDGAFPALIQWAGAAHPAQRLPSSGCALRRLTIRHPNFVQLQQDLASALRDDRIAIETGAPGFSAEVMTPHGPRVLT